MGAEQSTAATHHYAEPVPNTAIPGKCGPIWRSVQGDGPKLMVDGCTTAYETFNHGVAINPNGNCLGRRPIAADGTAGPYEWWTYVEVATRRDNLASGLMSLGLIPPPPAVPTAIPTRFLGIYAPNRPEWVLAEQACYCHSSVVVPMYDTLLADGVAYVMRQTSCETLCAGLKQLPVLLETAKLLGDDRKLRNIVCMDPVSPDMVREFQNAGLRLMAMAEVEEHGRANPVPHRPPASREVATFCYTSGTTGDPKGALITHANLISDFACVRDSGFEIVPSDVHLSYLPLPHMFERIIQMGLYNDGCAVGFYQGDTLKIVEDLQALRPTVFPSVPRLLTRIYDKLMAGVVEAGGIKKALFERALSAKLANLQKGELTHPVWDRLVFSGVKGKVGLDRVRLLCTGSAPLAPHVMSFLRAVFGCPVLEGYGQTECAAAATITHPDDQTVGHVGGPVSCNEIRLEDVPEMGYLSTDTTHVKNANESTPCRGRGEICFRGPNVFAGYYAMEEKTREAIDADGWLHSGDIGIWLENGALAIVDRKKNIFKLAQGEYVAPEKLENIYQRSPLVMQAFVHGDSLEPTLVAVVVPDPENVEVWAKGKKGLEGRSYEDLCNEPRLMKEIMKQMDKQATASKLNGFERIRSIMLTSELFSVENDLLTPTFKLKRQQAREKYQSDIARMYAEQAAAKAGQKSKL